MTAQERREQRMEETLKKLPFWEHLEERNGGYWIGKRR